MKVKHRNGSKVLLKPVNVKKRRENLLKSFRTYRNYERFGLKNKKAMKKRMHLKGRGPTTTTGSKSFVTDNDNEWIRKLNPYDKLIANKSVKTLNAINKLVGSYEPDLKNSSLSDQIRNLTQLKSTLVQEVMGYTGKGAPAVKNALRNTFKDLGLTLVGKGWLWESGQEKLESTTEQKQKIVAAVDDLINQARNKGQEALSQLNQLYLKQGDREEQEQIRTKEEEKQDKKNDALREKDRLENIPKYQSVDEVNPLGFSSGKKYRSVDTSDPSQVRFVRNNPFTREQDKSYISKVSTPFEAHRASALRVDPIAQRQKVVEQAARKPVVQQQQQGSASSW